MTSGKFVVDKRKVNCMCSCIIQTWEYLKVNRNNLISDILETNATHILIKLPFVLQLYSHKNLH